MPYVLDYMNNSVFGNIISNTPAHKTTNWGYYVKKNKDKDEKKWWVVILLPDDPLQKNSINFILMLAHLNFHTISWSFSIGLNARKFLHYNNVVDLHCQPLFKEEEEKKLLGVYHSGSGHVTSALAKRNQSHGAARVTSDRFPFLHSNFIPSKKKTNELCEAFHYVAGNSIKSLLTGSFGSPGRLRR